ncbi:MAG TPA: DUF3618 domain-containing protein [Gemmatimonadales bacterium]|nr:DUF3618 domain-containing protein [Gemmatimonadales bacterium]
MTDYQRRTDRGTDSEDTRQLERDIESTRARMSRDLDELGERLRPSNIAHEAAANVSARARETGYQLADFVRDNSLAVAAMGLGATWFFTQRTRGGPVSGDRMARYSYEGSYTGPERRRSSGSIAAPLKEKAWEAGESIRETGRNVSERVSDTASDFANRAEDAAGRAKEKASEWTSDAKDKAAEIGERARWQTRRARNRFAEIVEQNPLAVAAGALVLGLTIGFVLPSTSKEDEWMGPARDRLAGRAEATVDRVKDAASEAAGDVADTVRSEVPEIKDAVRDAADHVKQQVKESAGDVAQQAKQAARNPSAAPSETQSPQV